MNTVILTPDRVGSTLLQRVLTIYMLGSGKFDKPVVNLHELVWGIESMYSDIFKQNILQMDNFNYSQSLKKITNILANTTSHFWTGRLSHIHICNRNDPVEMQSLFYEFLNNNTYIIAAQRESVFEYALSRGLYLARKNVSRPGNAYSHEAKTSEAQFFNSPITISKQEFFRDLNAYDDYIKWTALNFDVDKFFIYEQDMPNIDHFINNLGFMKDTKTFNEMFGIEWNDWNRCHRLTSDVLMQNRQQLLLTDQTDISNLPVQEQEFVNEHKEKYYAVADKINQAVTDGNLIGGIPIKMQTLVEKKLMISNFNECAVWYNEWASANDYDVISDTAQIIEQSNKELKHWYEDDTTKLLTKLP